MLPKKLGVGCVGAPTTTKTKNCQNLPLAEPKNPTVGSLCSFDLLGPYVQMTEASGGQHGDHVVDAGDHGVGQVQGSVLNRLLAIFILP